MRSGRLKMQYFAFEVARVAIKCTFAGVVLRIGFPSGPEDRTGPNCYHSLGWVDVIICNEMHGIKNALTNTKVTVILTIPINQRVRKVS